MPRTRVMQLAAAALLAVGLTGCAGIPANLHGYMNGEGAGAEVGVGARPHAIENVAQGRPTSLVLCSIPTSDASFDVPTLIPSFEVAALGCDRANQQATAVSCAEFPIFGMTVMCNASGARVLPPVVTDQAQASTPAVA